MMLYYDYPLDQLLDLLETQNVAQGRAAADALGRVGLSAVEPLLQILREDRPMSPRADWAIEALVRIGLPAVEPLLGLLHEDNRWARTRAIYTLGSIGDRRVVAPLLEQLEEDDPLVRKSSAAALGELGDERAVAPLLDRLTDPDRNVVHDVDEALVAISEPVVRPALAILEDRDYPTTVRARVIGILGKVHDERALAPLTTILLDRTEARIVRATAADALSDLDGQHALDSLVQVIARRDEEPKMRMSAIRSIRDRQSFPALLAVLRDTGDDDEVRAVVAAQLCILGGRQAIDPLVAALSDPSASVRMAAASALGRCGDATVLPTLQQAAQYDPSLEDTTTRARIAIARRFSLPLAANDDPAGKLVAAYGPISLYEVNGEPKPQLGDRMLYLVRLSDPEGNIDLDKLALVMPEDRGSVLSYLRRNLEKLGNDAVWLTQRLRDAYDQVDLDQLGERLARVERQGRAIDYAMRELEGNRPN